MRVLELKLRTTSITTTARKNNRFCVQLSCFNEFTASGARPNNNNQAVCNQAAEAKTPQDVPSHLCHSPLHDFRPQPPHKKIDKDEAPRICRRRDDHESRGTFSGSRRLRRRVALRLPFRGRQRPVAGDGGVDGLWGCWQRRGRFVHVGGRRGRRFTGRTRGRPTR